MGFLSYNLKKQFIVVTLLIFVNGGCAHAEQSTSAGAAKSESNDGMAALLAKESYNPKVPLKGLGSAYTTKIKGNIYEIRYCPDNTCEILKGLKADKQVVDDLAFIYFARASTYANLQSYQKAVPDDAIEKAQSKYSSRCPKSGDAGIRCQLRDLAMKFKIKLLFSRFDEGTESFRPIQIKD